MLMVCMKSCMNPCVMLYNSVNSCRVLSSLTLIGCPLSTLFIEPLSGLFIEALECWDPKGDADCFNVLLQFWQLSIFSLLSSHWLAVEFSLSDFSLVAACDGIWLCSHELIWVCSLFLLVEFKCCNHGYSGSTIFTNIRISFSSAREIQCKELY